MTTPEPNDSSLADRVRSAFDTADIGAIRELLDEKPRWGDPSESIPACQSRSDVIEWYRDAIVQGMRARVSETAQIGDCIVVGLKVTGARNSLDTADETERWQVLTVRRSRIVEIRGYDDRAAAFAYARDPLPTWGPRPGDSAEHE